MLLETLLYVIGAVLIIAGFYWRKEKRTEMGSLSAIVGIVLVAGVFASGAGYLAPLAATPGEPGYVPETGDFILIDGECQLKPYTQLTFSGSTFGANDYTAPAGEVKIFAANVDPGAANVNYIDKMQVTAGVGTTTNATLTSCTEYTIVYDGRDAEYDVMYSSTQLPYVSTTESSITNAILQFGPESIIVASTIPDPIEENDVTGIINGQIDLTRALALTNEIQVGADGSPADSDVVYYNDTNGDTSFYLDLTLGAEGGNTKLKAPVMCFVNDITNPMEGTEFTDISVQLQSGTDLGIPSDVTDYFTTFGCIPMGAWIEGGDTGIYRFTFTVDEGNTDDAGADILYIFTDDCGSYLGKDIMNDQDKATAGAVIEIQFLA